MVTYLVCYVVAPQVPDVVQQMLASEGDDGDGGDVEVVVL